MKKCEKQKRQASRKAENKKQRQLAAALPIGQYLAEARVDVEAFAARLGPTVMRRIMEEEIQSQAGAWGKQTAHRHGHQAGHVVYAGRKVALSRPRLRRDDQEVRLARYQAFQKNGKLQQAVARHLTRQCSTRDYEGAIEQCLKGYGIKRSSVSRHWKAATTQELQQLMERAVPADLLVLMIDSKFFAGQCIPAAIGIDVQGKKHVLGLWHGATESAAVVKGLLEDLVARGLDSERKILVVIDGAKALRKAVQMVLGENGLVQRCRLHKERNVLDQFASGETGPSQMAPARSLEPKRPQDGRKGAAQNRPLAGGILAHGGGQLAGRLGRNPPCATAGDRPGLGPLPLQHQSDGGLLCPSSPSYATCQALVRGPDDVALERQRPLGGREKLPASQRLRTIKRPGKDLA
jgi:putative transposase